MPHQAKRKPHRGKGKNERKHCSKCDRWLPLTNYYRDPSRWDGLNCFCGECQKAMSATWRKGHPAIVQAGSKRRSRYIQIATSIYPILFVCMLHNTIKEIQDAAATK